MATVEIKGVKKSFGSTPIINDVSMAIADGEFVVLVGPSGCGKSTLLRMIAGLEDISDGTVAIGSKIVNHVAPKDRNIAMVFQNYALYPHMTVANNMSFALRLKGTAKPTRDQHVEQASKVLAIQALLDRFPRQLSGGQRQRVAMGRAIVRDPEVFLFDEPLSNLDAKLRVQVRTEIKELHQRLRTTTIYVTHDQIEAMTMADRIVVLRDGVVMQIGAPLDIYDRPQNTFVAGFIGSPAMNFFNGVISATEPTQFLTVGGAALPLGKFSSDFVGRPVIYGIRPEHLSIDPERGVPCNVLVVEPTGSETHVLATLGGQTITGIFRQRVSCRPGDTVPLYSDALQAHLFEPSSLNRIN